MSYTYINYLDERNCSVGSSIIISEGCFDYIKNNTNMHTFGPFSNIKYN